eukprot:TRINITY_DN5844_c0_g1_i1.p2 TRINITY_DN5844_c0_g1~~TRINITY_DN5844_c0_g1_i1.p2  ORF type:complete len:168 (+),score=41.97 TRINITY_DN5844_c0_g1_i1:481-984(+)
MEPVRSVANCSVVLQPKRPGEPQPPRRYVWDSLKSVGLAPECTRRMPNSEEEEGQKWQLRAVFTNRLDAQRALEVGELAVFDSKGDSVATLVVLPFVRLVRRPNPAAEKHTNTDEAGQKGKRKRVEEQSANASAEATGWRRLQEAAGRLEEAARALLAVEAAAAKKQ